MSDVKKFQNFRIEAVEQVLLFSRPCSRAESRIQKLTISRILVVPEAFRRHQRHRYIGSNDPTNLDNGSRQPSTPTAEARQCERKHKEDSS